MNAADLHPRKRVAVLDSEMSYVDVGEGDPIVFLHGNPTSSYLWRNIIAAVSRLGRCLAPDLVGMGQSGRSPTYSYRFVDHARYLDAWFEAMQLHNVVLVVHDWGSALGFHRLSRYPQQFSGIAYMEAIVTPLSWADWPSNARGAFQGFRSPGGEAMILEKNMFVERILPGSIMRRLSDAEMAEYRRPFATRGEDRRPTLSWPRQIPIEGSPADVVTVVEDYSRWLSSSDLPKLFINADPGSILVGRQRELCRRWPNQTELTVPGQHFLQEDSPDPIGRALADFVSRVRPR